MTSQIRLSVALIAAFTVSCSVAVAAEATVAQTLEYAPIQKDVEYETPPASEFSKCKVEVEKKGKSRGYVVYGPQGQILRKFLDTNGDDVYDQYSYYNLGIEVYRDIDTNGNKKIDQFRWLNRGGSRWGIDRNEDGRIDQWKILSAAEATREAIRAMASSDWTALQAVMVTADDLKSLGVNESISTRLLESVGDVKKKAEGIMKNSKGFTAQAVWTRFDAQLPCIIPVDDEKAKDELQVYESAYAIIETPAKKGADKIATAVQIGEMIRVGDTWKLTQVPQPIEGNALSTTPILMESPVPSHGSEGSPTAPSPKVEKLLKDLAEIEQKVLQPGQSPAQVKTLMTKRSALLAEARELASTEDEKALLIKQNVDGLAVVAQMGTYPDGVKELKAIEAEYAKKAPKSPLLPYTVYRRMQAEYAVNSQLNDENDKEKQKEAQTDIQKTWLRNLEDFVKIYPDADDADDAMFGLGMHEELQGRSKEAEKWYRKLVAEKPKSDMMARAQGALTRLGLKDRPLALSGPLLAGGTIDLQKTRGKMVLVVFWNSAYKTCEEDIPQLRALYKEYKAKGLEIVGVALDTEKTAVQSYVTKNNMTWPQIFQPGGTNSPLSVQYGIISFPTMFLVKDGKVVSRNASLTEIKAELSDVLASKK